MSQIEVYPFPLAMEPEAEVHARFIGLELSMKLVPQRFFLLLQEASSDVQFYTEGDQLITNLAEIR